MLCLQLGFADAFPWVLLNGQKSVNSIGGGDRPPQTNLLFTSPTTDHLAPVLLAPQMGCRLEIHVRIEDNTKIATRAELKSWDVGADECILLYYILPKIV